MFAVFEPLAVVNAFSGGEHTSSALNISAPLALVPRIRYGTRVESERSHTVLFTALSIALISTAIAVLHHTAALNQTVLKLPCVLATSAWPGGPFHSPQAVVLAALVEIA